ncbi:hypothetical protein [Pseudoalteromonas rubra]|uniref:hypothetical protein n=1 Tax=Pseudoalteromonas rubra TaxID=43658 RepID=UPI002DBE5772|nr:hypothetical protein [Pseudoalteromonas rubra]MEC4091592.1 hypothetical protein [Pseudoalteromonas rubra]
MAKLSADQKEAIKQAFRLLPPKDPMTVCHRKLVAITGIDVKLRTLQDWVRKESWQRDLSEEVRQETARQMLKSQIIAGAERLGLNPDDVLSGEAEQQIEAAASASAAVLLAHQDDIGKLRSIYSLLAGDLEHQVRSNRKAVFSKEDGGYVERPVALKEKLSGLMALAKTLEKLVALERQAYGVDDTDNQESNDDLLRKLAEEAQQAEQED